MRGEGWGHNQMWHQELAWVLKWCLLVQSPLNKSLLSRGQHGTFYYFNCLFFYIKGVLFFFFSQTQFSWISFQLSYCDVRKTRVGEKHTWASQLEKQFLGTSIGCQLRPAQLQSWHWQATFRIVLPRLRSGCPLRYWFPPATLRGWLLSSVFLITVVGFHSPKSSLPLSDHHFPPTAGDALLEDAFAAQLHQQLLLSQQSLTVDL